MIQIIFLLLPNAVDRNVVRLLSGGFIDVFESAELRDNNPTLDKNLMDPTSSKSSDTANNVGFDNLRSEDGSPALKWLVRGVTAVVVIGVLLAVVPTVASAAGLITDNPLTAYAGFGLDQADDRLAGESDTVQEVSNEVRGPIESLMCFIEGPGCMRQRQADQRPGAQEVGQSYGLEIENFRVGNGDSIDVSYRARDSSIPVGFTVSNDMEGGKGIDAQDVIYRIKVIDGDRGVDNPYCDTGWLHLGNSDVDGDGRSDDIRKGTTAGSGFMDLNEDFIEETAVKDHEEYGLRYKDNSALTYKSCEMLQPALGETRRIMLRLRYDYYSGGRVTFNAMSRDYMLEENIKQEVQPSKAPDTPVSAAVNVKSPVTFTESGGRSPVPFGMDVFTETDDSGIRYRIKGIEVINSRYTRGVSSSCSFNNLEPGDRMTLKEEVENRVVYQPEIGNIDYWYSESNTPPLLGCRMLLDEDSLDQISRTGETLAYRVRANYTVSKKEPLDNFNVNAQGACSQMEMECPRLVTVDFNYSNPDYSYKTTCTGVDSYGGCTIVSGEDWQDPTMGSITRGVVDEGDVAVSLSNFGMRNATGFSESKWRRLDPDMDGDIEQGNWEQYSIISAEEDGETDLILHISGQKCEEGADPGRYVGESIYNSCSGIIDPSEVNGGL
ncbi:hypothetical protein [Candidatus Nanohalococcus occultus]|uniref:hypothetical protein n=1 Tax=Candidatus Nanohalococcus occultus TaxID=2978047 RepID=UPI0039E1B947